MPDGSLVFARETSPSAPPTSKAWLPALELPGLHFSPQQPRRGADPAARCSQGGVMGRGGLEGSRFQRDVRHGCCPPPFTSLLAGVGFLQHSLAQTLRERREKSFPQVKALKQLQVLDKGAEFEQLLA